METQVINDWLVKFEKSIKEKDIDAILDLFDKETYWRDLISFTWNIITLESKEDISLMLNKTIDKINPENFKIQEMLTSNSDVHEARFTFETITLKEKPELNAGCPSPTITSTILQAHSHIRSQTAILHL